MDDFMTTIGRIVEIFDGPHATPIKTDVGPYFLSISSLENGRLDLSKSAHLSEEDFKTWTKRVTPQKGDLLFSYETRLGEAALMPDGVRACLGRRMGLLRPHSDKVISEYLLYAYLSPAFQQTIVANTITGATVDRIALNKFSDFPIRIPRLDEQKKVAGLLKNIDAKIELNQRINAELESMAKTVFRYQFVENKEKGNWEIGILGDVAENIRRSANPSDISPKTHYIGLEHMPRKSIALSEYESASKVDSNKYAFKTGEFLFGKLRPYFHKVGIAPVDGICSTDILVIVPKSPEWYGFVLGHVSSDEIIKYADATSGGTKMPRTNWESLARFEIPIPPLELAKQYAEFFVPIAKQIRVNILESQTLTELRDWLLPMLMNGQIQI